MTVVFHAKDHKYESLNSQESILWISVTSFVSQFKKPFDGPAIARKCSNNKKSKWYGMEVKKILEIWDKESNRAESLGTWYHNQREVDLLSLNVIQRAGINIPVFKPIIKDGIKHAPDQRLLEGLYPELFVYLKSAELCGQSDLVEIINNTVNITDYKTNKEIKKTSFVNWEGISEKMTGPVSHLDDCNFNHYALQLSIYMYIILKHNHNYKPGKLIIHHILFEVDYYDEHGYPVALLNIDGEPMIKEIIPYELPYMKDEVIQMINWLKNNKHLLKAKN